MEPGRPGSALPWPLFWVTFCWWGVGQHTPLLSLGEAWCEHPLLHGPYRLLPISECLGRPNWEPKNTAGEDWEVGGVLGLPRGKGQGSHPASGKPGLLQASSYLGGCGQVEYGEHA